MEYQKCPICNGVGQVSGGFFDRAGDGETWTSDHATEICKVCQGTGLIIPPITTSSLPEKLGNFEISE